MKLSFDGLSLGYRLAVIEQDDTGSAPFDCELSFKRRRATTAALAQSLARKPQA